MDKLLLKLENLAKEEDLLEKNIYQAKIEIFRELAKHFSLTNDSPSDFICESDTLRADINISIYKKDKNTNQWNYIM